MISSRRYEKLIADIDCSEKLKGCKVLTFTPGLPQTACSTQLLLTKPNIDFCQAQKFNWDPQISWIRVLTFTQTKFGNPSLRAGPGLVGMQQLSLIMLLDRTLDCTAASSTTVSHHSHLPCTKCAPPENQ